MIDEPLELTHGSGNVFRDLGLPNANLHQAKALMGAQIIRILDEEGWLPHETQARTGIPRVELTRLRRATYSGFTLDRLMNILSRLGQEVDISIDVHPRRPSATTEVAPTML